MSDYIKAASLPPVPEQFIAGCHEGTAYKRELIINQMRSYGAALLDYIERGRVPEEQTLGGALRCDDADPLTKDYLSMLASAPSAPAAPVEPSEVPLPAVGNPLHTLGNRLSHYLDDDKFNECEHLVLQIAADIDRWKRATELNIEDNVRLRADLAASQSDYQRLMDKHNALHWNSKKHRDDLAASQAECERLRIPIGWKPAPFEPTAEMLDVAVSHALTVQISGEYNWSAYMRDVWMRMWSQIGAQSIPRAALSGEVKA